MPGSVLRSERFIVSVERRGRCHKVFQCQFLKRDGSVFISFPYFRHTSGLVSAVDWPAGQPSTAVSLEPGGKVASHLVKYSHHPSGRAHFSQDGRVRTVIKKQAVPLSEVEGHLFTLHVQGLEAFDVLDRLERNQPPSAKRTGLRFELKDDDPDGVKFVGRLHRDTWLEERAIGHNVHPIMRIIDADGHEKPAFVCSTPMGREGQQLCLVISCEPQPISAPNLESSMLFVAGFDSAAKMNDSNQPVSFLATFYPADNVEDLRERLGSIDLDAD